MYAIFILFWFRCHVRSYSLERLAPHSLYMTDECVSRAAAILLGELSDELESIDPSKSASDAPPVIFHVFGNASARIYHAAVLLMHSSAHSHTLAHDPSIISSPHSESPPADTDCSNTNASAQLPSTSAYSQRTSSSQSPSAAPAAASNATTQSPASDADDRSLFASVSMRVRGAVFDSCPARGGIRQESQEYAARFPLRNSSVQTLVRCLFVLVYVCNLVTARLARVCKRVLGFALGGELLFANSKRRLELKQKQKPTQTQTPTSSPKKTTGPASPSESSAAVTTSTSTNTNTPPPELLPRGSSSYICNDIFAECGAHSDTWRFFLDNDLPPGANNAAAAGVAACDCGDWPQLYLYSKKDSLTPYTDVRRVVLSRQRRAIERPKAATRTEPSRLDGLEGYVAATYWENSGHLQHLSRNESGYVKAIADFLEYVVPIAPPVSDSSAAGVGGDASASASDESPRQRGTTRRAQFRQGSSSDPEEDERPRSSADTVTLCSDKGGGETVVNSSEC